MPMRISGMSSGMDIDKIVSDLMKVERLPLTKIKREQQSLTWKTDAYRNINKNLASFRELLSTMRFTGSMSQTKAISSQANYVTATSNGSALATNHTIEVSALATGAKITSSATVSKPTLAAGAAVNSLTIDGTNNQFVVSLNGSARTITLDQQTYASVQDLAVQIGQKLDSAFGAGKVTVTESSGALVLESKSATSPVPQIQVTGISGNTGLTNLGFSNGQSNRLNLNSKLSDAVGQFSIAPGTTGSFKVNGQTISYTPEDTIGSIISQVNKSGSGVTMAYDAASDIFNFTSNTTGSTSNITLEEVSGGFVAALRSGSLTSTGSDAQVKIDNVDMTQASNTFTLDGVTYTLNKETAAVGPVQISVSKDTDFLVDKIKQFVSKYNDLVDLAKTSLIEKKDRSVFPLTDEEKQDMKDSEITVWESKAKKGLLYRDDILSQLDSMMRAAVTKDVGGLTTGYTSLFQVGVTTLPYDRANPQNAGKIQLDENKLREALSKDPEGVVKLFTNQPSTDKAENEKGVAQALYDIVNDSISRIIQKAGGSTNGYFDKSSVIGKKLSDLEVDVSLMNQKLKKKEDSYYWKFSLMEQALAKSNSQMSFLASKMG